MEPELSKLFKNKQPSAVRLAQIEFAKRKDGVKAVDTAVGNVSLPMHPLMLERLKKINSDSSPFKEGIVKYTSTAGLTETNQAFLNIISSSGLDNNNLYSQITDGASAAMQLVILGVSGEPGKKEKPVLLIDATYTNYTSLAERLGRTTISTTRHLSEEGKFTLPDLAEIEQKIIEKRPGALIVIPYDNPTGHFYTHETMVNLAKLCVKHNIWMVSDEAYRELFYLNERTSSIWGIIEQEVPGITGRRISLESSSKVWNACGLRIGALVTDNYDFHKKAVAEYTANLCASAIGQYIFGALAHASKEELNRWYSQQRQYYQNLMEKITTELKRELPELIVSCPDSSIYSVLDVRNIDKNFDSTDFVLYCSREGKVNINGEETTLLVAPMSGFYDINKGKRNPGATQMRIAYVASPKEMEKVPKLFSNLLKGYLKLKESNG